MTLWNQKVNERNFSLERPWYKFAISLLSDVINHDSCIVELGSGRGEFAKLIKDNFSSYNVSYLGLDGNPDYLNPDADLNFKIADFEKKIDLKSNSADIVVTLEVIEHLVNAENFLLEVSRVLKPGGILIISTPNVGFILNRLRYLLRAEVLQEGIHFRFFNFKLLSTKLQSANFRIIKKNSCMPFILYNFISRMLGGKRKYVKVPDFIESIFATNFIWALKNK
jgi:SAM-dependent methyltransferase